MKRFIDLSGQVTLGAERYFAWLDTATDQFERHGDSQYWTNWDEFARDYEGGELERYRSLAAPWVFGIAAEAEFPAVDTVAAVKLATLWVILAKIKKQIDNKAVPLGQHLGIEGPDLMIALEQLSEKIGAHFSRFKLVAEPRKIRK